MAQFVTLSGCLPIIDAININTITGLDITEVSRKLQRPRINQKVALTEALTEALTGALTKALSEALTEALTELITVQSLPIYLRIIYGNLWNIA